MYLPYFLVAVHVLETSDLVLTMPARVATPMLDLVDLAYPLRRHDYRVEASGGCAAASCVYELRTVQGIALPIRRRAYMRDRENRAIREKVMMSIDMSEVAFL